MKIIIALIGLLILSPFLMTPGFGQVADSPNNFGTTIYQFNGRYYVKDSQNIISSNETPDIIIETALARGGDIYLAGGTYYLSNSFSGFDLNYGTHLKLATNAHIVIPSGYAGYVFRFNNGTSKCMIDGGKVFEANPVERHWTGIMLQGGTRGVYFNYVENMVISNPKIVIDFNATTRQWINANTFVNIQADNFVRGIEFDFNGKYTDGVDGFNGNTFRDSQFQSGSMTNYGVKDIKHKDNAFYNVQFWDLPLSATSSTIDSSAENTIIIGGQMTYQNFSDIGKNTIILDAWHTRLLSNSTTISEIIRDVRHINTNMSNTTSNQILNMTIIQQGMNNVIHGNQGLIVLSSGRSINVNIFGIVNYSTGGTVTLNVIRPDGVVEHNQAAVTTAGAFYYPITFDKNSLIGQYEIDGIYHNSNLGSLFLNVTDHTLLSTKSSTNPNMDTSTMYQSNSSLYTKFKGDAKLWSHGEISNNSFWVDVENLAKIKIIETPNEIKIPMNQSINIPTWFKNNAGLWADGQISDNEFFSGLQYLINSRIIKT